MVAVEVPKPPTVCPGALEGAIPKGVDDAGVVVANPPPKASGLEVAAGALKLNAGAVAVVEVLAPNPPRLKAGAALVEVVVPNPPNDGGGADAAGAVPENPQTPVLWMCLFQCFQRPVLQLLLPRIPQSRHLKRA